MFRFAMSIDTEIPKHDPAGKSANDWKARLKKDQKWLGRIGMLAFCLVLIHVILRKLAEHGILEGLSGFGLLVGALGMLCFFVAITGGVMSLALRHPSSTTLRRTDTQNPEEGD